MSESLSIIPGLLSFEYVQNHGAVFGIMQGSNYIMAAISAVLCVIISIYIIKSKKDNPNIHFAWYMILSGGIGNLIDRLFRGYVVDFIATPFIATFNIADSMVVIGVCLLIINEVVEIIKEKRVSNKQ
jgi:signal peptidase II